MMYPHPFEADLVYLVGGEKVNVEIGTFPHHHKRAIRDGDTAYLVDDSALTDFWGA